MPTLERDWIRLYRRVKRAGRKLVHRPGEPAPFTVLNGTVPQEEYATLADVFAAYPRKRGWTRRNSPEARDRMSRAKRGKHKLTLPYPLPDAEIPPGRRRSRLFAFLAAGFTPAEVSLHYAALLRGACDVCGAAETARRGKTALVLSLDHDHQTGRYRGTICAACNSVLGHGRDNPTRLRALADYLERTA